MNIKSVAIAIGAAALLGSGLGLSAAMAEVQDRVVLASQEPEIVRAQVIAAANVMCREAAAKGEVVDVRACVRSVVRQTELEARKAKIPAFNEPGPAPQTFATRN
jgi:hypothetical protein